VGSPAPGWRSTQRRAVLGGAGREGRLRLGTSSRSSKLVHGGLRYLQNFDLGLVREALLERQLMVKLAPHLVVRWRSWSQRSTARGPTA